MALLVLGLFNGLVFLPVLLVIVGPPAQITPSDSADSLPPATPQPSPGESTLGLLTRVRCFISLSFFSEIQSPSSETPAPDQAKQRLWVRKPRQQWIQFF